MFHIILIIWLLILSTSGIHFYGAHYEEFCTELRFNFKETSSEVRLITYLGSYHRSINIKLVMR